MPTVPHHRGRMQSQRDRPRQHWGLQRAMCGWRGFVACSSVWATPPSLPRVWGCRRFSGMAYWLGSTLLTCPKQVRFLLPEPMSGPLPMGEVTRRPNVTLADVAPRRSACFVIRRAGVRFPSSAQPCHPVAGVMKERRCSSKVESIVANDGEGVRFPSPALRGC